MATTVAIQDDRLTPGTTIRMDFEILTTNAVQLQQVVASIKRAIATDDRFDYQGSKLETVGDLKRQRDVQVLSIWATVRKERREARTPIEYAHLSTFEAMVRSAPEALGYGVKHLNTQLEAGLAAGADALRKGAGYVPTVSVAVLLIGAGVAYAFFFGVPKHAN